MQMQPFFLFRLANSIMYMLCTDFHMFNISLQSASRCGILHTASYVHCRNFDVDTCGL